MMIFSKFWAVFFTEKMIWSVLESHRTMSLSYLSITISGVVVFSKILIGESNFSWSV